MSIDKKKSKDTKTNGFDNNSNSKRTDHRDNVQVRDQKSVDETADETHNDTADDQEHDRERNAHIREQEPRIGGDDARDCHDGADGDINAAENDHICKTRRKKRVCTHLRENVTDISRAEKRTARNAESKAEQDQNQHHNVFTD